MNINLKTLHTSSENQTTQQQKIPLFSLFYPLMVRASNSKLEFTLKEWSPRWHMIYRGAGAGLPTSDSEPEGFAELGPGAAPELKSSTMAR